MAWTDEALIAGCSHGQVDLRKRTYSAGQVAYVYQCLNCGHHVRNVPRVQVTKPVTAWDADLPKRYQQAVRDAFSRREQIRLGERHREEEDWWKWYEGYLESQAWKDRRRQALLRCGHICEGCGSRPAVEVHHLTYEHVGNEFLWELRAVCRECHERLHPQTGP